MAPIQFPRLAAVNCRKRPADVLWRRTSIDTARLRSTFSFFHLTPHVMLSTFSMISSYENRQLQQPLLTLQTLISRTVQDGLMAALVHYLTKAKIVTGSQSTRQPIKRQKKKGRVEARKNWENALKLEKEMDLEGAIRCLERAVKLQPMNCRYLAMLSKQYTDMSFAPHVTHQEAKEYNKKALTISQKVVDLSPEDPVGYIARGVSKGRLAYYSNNREKIELAREAEDSVKSALNLDDSSDLGHHLMGRFHYEMAGLNMFCRAFVRIVYGKTMSPGCYEEALKEFERAHNLKPERMIHKIQLGKTYVKLGDKQQAMESLQDALGLEVIDINDHLEQLEGIRLLKKLQNEK